MALIYITNCEDYVNRLMGADCMSVFTDYLQDLDQNILFRVDKKIRKKNENFVEFSNGDFIAGVGTYVYENRTGENALRDIYANFESGINQLKEDIIGNYCIFIKKGGRAFVFVDKYEVINTYYYTDGERWVISNYLANIPISTTHAEINEYPLIEYCFNDGILGRDTFFKGVYKLLGFEFIEIDPETGVMKVNELPIQREVFGDLSLDEYADLFSARMIDIIKSVKVAFGENLGSFMTGGVDNRGILAALLNVGAKPTLMYGVGNSPITNTKTGDLIAVKAIAKRFNLQFYQMDWSTNENISGCWRENFEKYGFYSDIYSSSEGFVRELESKLPGNIDIIFTGYYGENFRSRLPEDYYGLTPIDMNTFIRQKGSFLGKSSIIPDFEEYITFLEKKLRYYCNIYGVLHDEKIDGETTFPSVYETWYNLLRRNPDSSFTNYINLFTNCMAVCSSPKLHDAFALPAEHKKNERFMLNYMEKTYPEVLEIPFFSHCCNQRMDPGSKGMKRSATLMDSLISLYSNMDRRGLLKPFAKKAYDTAMYGLKREERKSIDERKDIEKLHKQFLEFTEAKQNGLGIHLNIQNYDGDIRRLIKYCQTLHGIELIKEKTKL